MDDTNGNGNGRRSVKLPPINTILQLAQLVTFIGGIIVVAIAIGRRDAVLESLVKASDAQTVKLQTVAESVAKIEGRLDPVSKE